MLGWGPQKIIQSPNRLYKDITYCTKPKNVSQRHKMVDKDIKY